MVFYPPNNPAHNTNIDIICPIRQRVRVDVFEACENSQSPNDVDLDPDSSVLVYGSGSMAYGHGSTAYSPPQS